MRAIAALLLVAGTACKAKEPDAAVVVTAPARPAIDAAVRRTEPVGIGTLLAEAKQKVPRQHVTRVQIDYVAPDGTLDPAYGVVELVFGYPPRGPDDDPARPTGAPVKAAPKKPPEPCHHLVWKDGVWIDRPLTCTSAAALAMHCPVPIIWERAIAKGAPRDAVAKLVLQGTGRGRWIFRIDDDVRDVHFAGAFDDDCGLVAEAPDPSVGPDTVPDMIDRTIIANTIGTVKPAVTACGDKHLAKGTVKVSVKVAPAGTSTVTVRQTPHPALGVCVRDAVSAARFPATRNGGSFSYPFVF